MHKTITIQGREPSTMNRADKADAIRAYAEQLGDRDLDHLLRIARAYAERGTDR